MASGTINGSCDNRRYILTCEWTSTPNTSANTSSITAKVYLNGNGYTTSSSYWSCIINGTTVTSNKNASIGGKTLLGTRTWTVNHNDDGTASVGISFSYSNGLNSSGTYTTKTGSGSATVRLDTIARGSSMSLSRSSATIGSDSITVNITRNSSAYKHKVKLILGDTTYLLAENVDTSYTFTPSMSYCNKITTATSGTATVKVETLTGTNGSWIAETTKTLTLNVPSNVVPSVGISVVANNQTNGVSVAGKTTFTVKPVNANGSYGSTITSYSITGGNLNSVSPNGAITDTLNAGDYTFVVKVTDSRGRTAEASKVETVHAYSSPTISARAFRCNKDGTESSSGVYIAVNFSWEITNLANNNSNAKQYFIQYKTSSASSYTTSVDWTNLSSYSGSMTKVLSQTFSTTSSYNIQLKVKDSFGTTTSTLSVSTISALLNIEKGGVGVGKIHENGALDVGGAIYTTKGIYSGDAVYVKTDPNGNVRFGYHAGTTDTFISNTANNWLRLKADKTMTYAGYKVYTSFEKPTPSEIGALSSSGDWSLNYGTALYGKVSGNTENRRIAQISSSGWVDLGDTRTETAICSAGAPTWWNGSNGYKIYTEGNKPTPAAIGALGNSGSQTLHVAQGKFLITGNGGYGHIDVAGGFHTRGDSNDIWFERHVMPASWNNASLFLGYSDKRWKAVYAANGTIQTSDIRYKSNIKDVDNEVFNNMIKNTPVHTYVLNDTRIDLKDPDVVPLTEETAEQEQIHLGIIAQELDEFEGAKYILNYHEESGYSVNNYNLTSAIISALKHEIYLREKEDNELKNETDGGVTMCDMFQKYKDAGKEELIIKMIESNILSIEQIAEITKLPVETIKALSQKVPVLK